MTLRIICLFLILFGGTIVTISGWRYHKFLRRNRDESYGAVKYPRAAEVVLECMMVFYFLGYLAGAADVLRREVEPVYLFTSLVFFIGGLFVGALMQFQISMADSLREKSMDIMRSYVNSVEQKDPYTQGHSWHVYHLTRAFCVVLPPHLSCQLNMTKLADAALLHDIGKIGVPDEVLKKRGPLEDEEWLAIRSHPELGRQMLSDTCYAEIGDWVLYHHERMDGTGYHGLPGAQIPLEARILAVTDTYSAVTTDREYRPKRNHAQAMEIMRQVAGTQLDAELVECFAAVPARELEGLSTLLRQQRAGHF